MEFPFSYSSTNDSQKRRLSKKRNRRRLQMEQLESRRVLAAYISEFHFNPLFGDIQENQYLELRGEPGSFTPEGTYFVGIEGSNFLSEIGDVHSILDVSNIPFGANGLMVFLQAVKDPGGIGGPPPGYSVDPAANVLQGTNGFQGLPGSIFQADFARSHIEAGTSSYLLIQSDVAPTLTTDIDANNDGTPDGVYEDWKILDGFATVPFAENNNQFEPEIKRTYAPIVFSERGAGDSALPDASIIRTQQQSYAGRIGGSVGYAAHEWLTGNTREQEVNSFDFQFQHGEFGTPRPEAYGGRTLDHIGAPNWWGSFSGTVFEDTNENGTQDPGEMPLDGVTIRAQQRTEMPTFWETIEPNDYADETDISNISDFVTTVTTDENNIHLGFKNIATQDAASDAGEHVFSQEGVTFFNHLRRLRMDFYRPVRTVEIDVIGNDDNQATYGRLEGFNAAGESLGFVRSVGQGMDDRTTMRISLASDEIAWAVAYSDNLFLDSSEFGRFDSLRIEVPYVDETVVTDGKFSFTPLFNGSYDVSVVDAGDYAQTFPENLESQDVAIIDGSHVSQVNFGFELKTAATLADQNISFGELIEKDSIIANLPVELSYPGQEVELAIQTGDDNDQFSIENNTFDLLAAKGDFDFEAQDSFTLVVEVKDTSDAQLTSTATLNITIEDENDAPEVADQQATIPENSPAGTSIATLSATDQDSSNFSWSIAGGNVGGAFTIDPVSAAVTIANPNAVNFEVTPIFDLVIRATDDGDPAAAGDGTLQVRLTDLDEIPIVSEEDIVIGENTSPGGQVGFLQVIEPDAGENVTWRIFGGDAAKFLLIPQTGELRLANGSELDFETQPTLTFTAEATDSAIPPKTGAGTVTVSLIDLNDAPQFLAQDLGVAENSAPGTSAGRVNATDQDAGQSLTYEIIGGRDAAAVLIDATTGEFTLSEDANLDFETQPELHVAVQITDNFDPPANASQTLTIPIDDANDPPELPSNALSIDENSAPGTLLAIPVNDPDANDTHTFELLSQSQDWFELTSDKRQLQVKAGAVIDFETQPQSLVELKVIDQAGAEGTGTVTINATDANDPPVLSSPIPDVETESGQPFTYVFPADTFTDQDFGDVLTYTATASDGFPLPNWLSFDATNRRFSGTPSDSDIRTHGVRVNAIDGDREFAFDVFNIHVVSSNRWHNADLPEDVTGDGFVVPRDALIVINVLNTEGGIEVPLGSDPIFGLIDVNNDLFITPLDALIIINFLNDQAGGEGEGNTSGAPTFYGPLLPNGEAWLQEDEDDELLEKLALDALGGI